MTPEIDVTLSKLEIEAIYEALVFFDEHRGLDEAILTRFKQLKKRYEWYDDIQKVILRGGLE